MRISLRTAAGWLVPLMYLALPNCGLPTSGLPGGEAAPLNNAIYCDIETPKPPDTPPDCAETQAELDMGIRLSEAALALVNGETTHSVIDDSPTARALCPNNEPRLIEYTSPFPKGVPKCLNCSIQVGPELTFESEQAACVSKCVEMFPGQDAFCADHARVSTNANNACADPAFQNACTNGGMESPDFLLDPRLVPEPVEWRDLELAAAAGTGNSLEKTGPGTGDFDAGAASVQSITKGDGYLEFTAIQVDKARAAGLSVGDADNDATLDSIGFAVRLSPAGEVFIHESGVEQVGGNPDNVFTPYESGDRIRVTFTDNFDGTATIAYFRIPAACKGPSCQGMLLRTAGSAGYPLRVDASLRTPQAVLDDVRVVFIKK